MRTRDEALHLLGVADGADGAAIRAAYERRRGELEQRLAAAPTQALLQKYQSSLGELVGAYEQLTAGGGSAGGLSATQLGDLPQADPSYTQHEGGGGRGTLVTLGPGTVLAERYEIRRLLGTGGMGAVYEAHDRLKQEAVALKVLLPHLLASDKARERFLNEARVACRLSHSNIVRVHDVGASPPHFFLTMELLQGQTLRHKIEAVKAARQPFPVEEVQRIGTSLAGALVYAHRTLVHRDLKPENIWLTEEGEVKLMDFGIARAFTNTELTKTGLALGTAYYMAPEQLTGAKDVDARADQYSLGVMLYELLTGQIPQGAIQAPRALRPEVPARLSAAVMRALSPRPDDRYPDLAEFVTALNASGLSLGAVAADPRLRRLAVAGAALAALMLLVLLALGLKALLPDREAEQQARTAAIQAQAATGELLRRLDTQTRQIEERVREKRGVADRLAERIGQARGSADRQRLEADLRTARAEVNVTQRQQALMTDVIRPSSRLVDIKAKQALGEASLRDGHLQEAAESLVAVRSELELMLAAVEAVPRFVETDAAYDALAETTRELVERYRGNLAEVMAPASSAYRDAERATQSGDIATATTALLSAYEQLRRSLGRFVEGVVTGYRQIAKKKMDSGDLNAAEAALKEAKRLQAWLDQL